MFSTGDPIALMEALELGASRSTVSHAAPDCGQRSYAPPLGPFWPGWRAAQRPSGRVLRRAARPPSFSMNSTFKFAVLSQVCSTLAAPAPNDGEMRKCRVRWADKTRWASFVHTKRCAIFWVAHISPVTVVLLIPGVRCTKSLRVGGRRPLCCKLCWSGTLFLCPMCGRGSSQRHQRKWSTRPARC